MEERTWYGVPGTMTGILATGNSGRILSFNGSHDRRGCNLSLDQATLSTVPRSS
ncbi:hypothetical protein BH11GEM2_BH11GEM2_16670 [soil metagenome]